MRPGKRGVSYVKTAILGLADCRRAHPPLFFGLMIVSAMLCAVEVGELYAMRRLFDASFQYAEGAMPFSSAVTAGFPMAVLLIASPFVNLIEWLGQGYFWRRGSGVFFTSVSLTLRASTKNAPLSRTTRACRRETNGLRNTTSHVSSRPMDTSSSPTCTTSRVSLY